MKSVEIPGLWLGSASMTLWLTCRSQSLVVIFSSPQCVCGCTWGNFLLTGLEERGAEERHAKAMCESSRAEARVYKYVSKIINTYTYTAVWVPTVFTHNKPYSHQIQFVAVAECWVQGNQAGCQEQQQRHGRTTF